MILCRSICLLPLAAPVPQMIRERNVLSVNGHFLENAAKGSTASWLLVPLSRSVFAVTHTGCG